MDELALANLLPLMLTGRLAQRPRVVAAYWNANCALARLPGLRRLATNVELVAHARN